LLHWIRIEVSSHEASDKLVLVVKEQIPKLPVDLHWGRVMDYIEVIVRRDRRNL
jgi:hypothetical protein